MGYIYRLFIIIHCAYAVSKTPMYVFYVHFFLETGVLFQKVMTIATKSKRIADLLWRYSKFYYLEKSFCNILQMLHVSLYKYL